MLRHTMGLIAVLLVCHLFCGRASAGETPQKTPSPSADATDWKADIESALEKKVSVAFDEQPLDTVIDYLREQMGVTVLADVRALDDVGLGVDIPVSAKLSDIPLRSLLRHLLQDFELTWTLRDGALVITTPEETESELETKVFDVVDLIRVNGQAAPDEYDYDSIISLITTTIAPQSWDTVGGPGSIEAFRGGVVVSQTPDVLELIRETLAIFRKAKEIAEEHADKAPPVVSVGFYDDDPAVIGIGRALESPLTFDFVETSLCDVAAFVATECQINVVVDHKALDDVGIEEDVPITFRVKEMRVRHALTHILRDLELRWVCRDHALVITTPEEAESELLTVAYPVADLLGKTLRTDLFDDPLRLWNHDDVIELATSIVAPQTWDCVGGPGSVDSCGHIDVLLVSQTVDVHEEMADLFGKVRQHLATCKESPVSQTEAQKSDDTRLVIYSVATAASNMNVPAAEKPATKTSVGQKKDATDGGSGLAQFGMGGMGGGFF